MIRSVVIGGTGLIGFHTVCELVSRGHTVTALARRRPIDGILPEGVRFASADLSSSKEEEILAALRNQDMIVHAAGADPRTLVHGSAREYFERINVRDSVRLFRLARESGVKRGILITSYFHALYPGMATVHPYVHSRVLSEEKSLQAAMPDLSLMILQPPYVFGVVPGRDTLGTRLVRYVRSPLPLFAPAGGTNVMSATALAQAIAGALDRGKPGNRYLVGDENLTWSELLARIAGAADRSRKIHIVSTTSFLLFMRIGAVILKIVNQEAGLKPGPVSRVILNRAFYDPAPSASALGYVRGDLGKTIQELVAAD